MYLQLRLVHMLKPLPSILRPKDCSLIEQAQILATLMNQQLEYSLVLLMASTYSTFSLTPSMQATRALLKYRSMAS